MYVPSLCLRTCEEDKPNSLAKPTLIDSNNPNLPRKNNPAIIRLNRNTIPLIKINLIPHHHTRHKRCNKLNIGIKIIIILIVINTSS